MCVNPDSDEDFRDNCRGFGLSIENRKIVWLLSSYIYYLVQPGLNEKQT